VRKIEFGLKGARNYFWYRARVNLSTAQQRIPVAYYQNVMHYSAYRGISIHR